LLGGLANSWHRRAHTGIVDQDIDTAKLAYCGINQCSTSVGVGDIRGYDCVSAFLPFERVQLWCTVLRRGELLAPRQPLPGRTHRHTTHQGPMMHR
jgi:hypothetical protein